MEPLTVDREALASLLGISTEMLDKRRKAGQVIAPIGISGRRPLWALSEVRAWVDAGAPHPREWEARREMMPGR